MTGAGEIWMLTGDQVIAENMRFIILELVQTISTTNYCYILLFLINIHNMQHIIQLSFIFFI